MTRFVLDVASYQGALTVADVVRAGFTAVNLKVSHGLTQKSVHPDLTGWITRSQAAGLSISTFHWLDNSAPGAEQAAYAYERLAQLGLAQGTVHVVDCEADATEAVLTGYVREMTARLGRPIAIYSADWWWQQTGRRWNGAALSPYLWGAPNAGYLGEYPGDSSEHWRAGWGGWAWFASIQYAVEPLFFPDGKQGTINVSKSAFRDSASWTALTGGGAMASWVLVPSLVALRAEFNEISPKRDKSTDGSIGDSAHADSVSDHNPDETGNTGGVEDSDFLNEVHAIDLDMSGPWPAGFSMEKAVQYIVGRCRSGAEKRFRYIIFNKRIWSASTGWTQKAYTGSNPHDKHAHFSAAYGSGSGAGNPENNTASYGLKSLITPTNPPPQEVDMPLDNTDKSWLKSPEYTKAVADAAAAATLKALSEWKFSTDSKLNKERTFLNHVRDLQDLRDVFVHELTDTRVGGRPMTGSTLDALLQAGSALTKKLDDLSALVTASEAAQADRDQATVAAVLQALSEIRRDATDPVTTEELNAALRKVFGEAFDRAEAEQGQG